MAKRASNRMGIGRIEVGDEVFQVALSPAVAGGLAAELRDPEGRTINHIIKTGLSKLAAERRYRERQQGLKSSPRSSR